MSSSHSLALKLIREVKTLIQEEPFILADAKDVDYFRALYRKEPVLKKEPLSPLSLAAKKPLFIEEMPLKEKEPLKVEIQPPPSLNTENPPLLATEKNAPLKETPPSFEKLPSIQKMPLPPQTKTFSFSSFQALLSQIAPQIPILKEAPSDHAAKKVKDRWKTKNQIAPITVLSLFDEEPQKKLLEEITLALDTYFGPAKLVFAETVEKENQWETFLSSQDLKWVIACDHTLWQLRSLMKFYKENPSTGSRELQNVSLFLLPDLSLYLKDPLLKRSLWKAICQKLSS